MSGQRPRRPAQGVIARRCHSQYTGDTSLIDQWQQWVDANGVLAVTLHPGVWVRTNRPHTDYRDTDLAVCLERACVLVRDLDSGQEHTFTIPGSDSALASMGA